MLKLLIVFITTSTLLWQCHRLIQTIPENLLSEYTKDQENLANYTLPTLTNYQYYTTIVCCTLLFILIFSFLQPIPTIKLLLLLFFCWSTSILACIDWRARLLTDNMVYPLLWLGLVANTFNIFCSTNQAIYGAIFMYLVFWIPSKLIKLIKQQAQGIGHGDMKMAAALGAWFGIHQSFYLLAVIFITAIPIALIFNYYGGNTQEKSIPFGIPLALGSWIYYGLFQI